MRKTTKTSRQPTRRMIRLVSLVLVTLFFIAATLTCGRSHKDVVVLVSAEAAAVPSSSQGQQQQQQQQQECIISADGSEVCQGTPEDDANNDEEEENDEEEHDDEDDNDEDDHEDDTSSPCVDTLGTTKCKQLALRNGCIRSFETMRSDCAKTCHVCGTSISTDDLNNAPIDQQWELPKLFNIAEAPQTIEGMQRVETYRYLKDVEEYMYETIYHDEEFQEIRTECQNRHALCTFWAFLGECENNPAYMKVQCAPSCFTCDQLIFENRCPFDPEAPTALNAGDLDKMFERILTHEDLQPYSPHAIMRPNAKDYQKKDDNAETAVGASSPLEGPWIVVLEDFLSPEECDTLVRLGAEQGYERSQDVGAKKFDGTYDATDSKERTSSNAWCTEACWEHEVTKRVHERLELLTGIPTENYEYLQLLRYEETQFYGEHHDYIDHQLNRAEGVRTLTVFLYLNDVEAGGGTHFSRVNQTVIPKQGRAVIWPSVLNMNPNKKDSRTMHEALPVEEGVKYGANAWIHQRDFKTPWKVGCH